MNISLYVLPFLIPVLGVICTLCLHYLLPRSNDIRAPLPLHTFEDLLVLDEDGKPQTSLAGTGYVMIDDLLQLEGIRPGETRVFDNEVYNTVQAAIAFKQAGKERKARKLFEHAAAIAPDDPDVLNRYGEFLEREHFDVVSADQLYLRALTKCPEHSNALENRRRVADMVDAMDTEMLDRIDRKRDELKALADSDGFRDAKENLYYLHIYHTVGIEGNTLSLEQLRYLLETGKAVAGKSIVEHNEVLGLQLAMKYVRILSRVTRITFSDILGIHRRVLGHARPLEAGELRDSKVFVGGHSPPDPELVPVLMEEFVEWLNSEEASRLHPLRFAALAHYKLVDIHPFADGNGRTARLLMNLILIRAGYPPVIVFKEHRHRYYESLKLANQGDVRPFVRFIAFSADHVLDLYLAAKRYLGQLQDNTSKTIGVT